MNINQYKCQEQSGNLGLDRRLSTKEHALHLTSALIAHSCLWLLLLVMRPLLRLHRHLKCTYTWKQFKRRKAEG